VVMILACGGGGKQAGPPQQEVDAEDSTQPADQVADISNDADEGETGTDGKNYKYDATTKSFYYRDAAGKTVHVNGYTRKDGTYVKPHDRAAPGAGKVGGKGGKGGKGK